MNPKRIVRQSRRPTRRPHRRGSETLEAALLLPIMLSMVFGIVQFGWYFHVQHTIQGAAREGARYAARASLSATDDHLTEADSRLRSYMTAAGVNPDKFDISFNPTDPDDMDAGDPITVTIESTWGRCGFQMFGFYIPQDRLIRGMAVMNKEG